MTTTPRADEIDLNDNEFWALPVADRDAAFTALRRERPIPHFDDPDYGMMDFIEKGSGYYALTRYKDVVDASRQPALFCSGRGATSIPDLPAEMLEFFGSIINMDDPRHKRLRDIVSKAFTVTRVRQIDDYIQQAADEIIARVRGMGECDFVTEISSRLPLKVICDMMGIPESQYDLVFDNSNAILGAADPEYVPEGSDPLSSIMGAAMTLTQLMNELGDARRANPTDDITSALVNANVDGEMLTQGELASFFILLVVAGNETTRNAMSWGIHTLTEHPGQRDIWASDYDRHQRSAVDEIVRWSTPVIYMRRSVTEDGARLGDKEFKQGDKVLLFYNSANRDEEQFDDPFRFDITRDPNPHVGFGGPGPHFCLGANLARQEIRVMFKELFLHLPDIRTTGEPDRLRSNFINGIKHLPVAFTPSR